MSTASRASSMVLEGVYQPAARFDAGVAGPPEGPHVQEYAPAFGSSRALASNRSRRLVNTLSEKLLPESAYSLLRPMFPATTVRRRRTPLRPRRVHESQDSIAFRLEERQ